MSVNILLTEDNKTIIKGLEYAFERKQQSFMAAETLAETRKILKENRVDILILDITLPDGNGLFFYETEVKKQGIPVIFLTAEDDEETVVKGLNLGAEDYVTKPFSTKELMARVNRILLRNQKKTLVQIQDIIFDMDKMLVTKAGNKVDLTSLELKLLHLLFVNKNRVVSRNTILDKIWEWTGNDVDDHTITVYLKRIREKVGKELIVTVKGIGYRVDEK